jgi:hypothetical protein
VAAALRIPGLQACRQVKAAVVVCKEADHATVGRAVAVACRTGQVLDLLQFRVRAPAATELVVAGVLADAERPNLPATVMKQPSGQGLPVWQPERQACLQAQSGSAKLACLPGQTPRGQSRLLFSRTKTSPVQEMHSASSQLLQLPRDAGEDARQTHHPSGSQRLAAVRLQAWAWRRCLPVRLLPALLARAPWRPPRGEVPWEPVSQPLSARPRMLSSSTALPPMMMMPLPISKSRRRLYQGGRANCRDCPTYYLIPDPSSSHQNPYISSTGFTPKMLSPPAKV